ncbi:hypothetical protein [Micromonospora sp. U21]|nr:hypothetical protein [Micromonospora sp. U21]MBQ0903086.1 hypothetical protein [Micromonospora sp. U21]
MARRVGVGCLVHVDSVAERLLDLGGELLPGDGQRHAVRLGVALEAHI